MKNKIKLALVLSTIAMAGCGGGDDDTDALASSSGAGCPNAQTSDVWMDQRLGCLRAGQDFINLSAGHVGANTATGDRAYVVNQGAYDKQFNNILGSSSGFRRYWAHFVCVRNAPLIPGGSGFNIGLAADLQGAMRLDPFNASIPPGIGTTTFAQYGGDRSGWDNTACNSALHPVIVNYSTGKIESVNPAALGAVATYTLAL